MKSTLISFHHFINVLIITIHNIYIVINDTYDFKNDTILSNVFLLLVAILHNHIYCSKDNIKFIIKPDNRVNDTILKRVNPIRLRRSIDTHHDIINISTIIIYTILSILLVVDLSNSIIIHIGVSIILYFLFGINILSIVILKSCVKVYLEISNITTLDKIRKKII